MQRTLCACSWGTMRPRSKTCGRFFSRSMRGRPPTSTVSRCVFLLLFISYLFRRVPYQLLLPLAAYIDIYLSLIQTCSLQDAKLQSLLSHVLSLLRLAELQPRVFSLPKKWPHGDSIIKLLSQASHRTTLQPLVSLNYRSLFQESAPNNIYARTIDPSFRIDMHRELILLYF